MSDQRVPPEELPIGNVDASGQAIDQSVDGLPEDDVDYRTRRPIRAMSKGCTTNPASIRHRSTISAFREANDGRGSGRRYRAG
jgi:hypothetical protein